MSQSLNNTILQVCRECRNFFEISLETNYFILSGGKIKLGEKSGVYRVGQYILLTGSFLADGIYKISGIDGDSYILDGETADDEWNGTVYGLRIPPDFVGLCEDINSFVNDSEYNSNIISETNANYSYKLATGKNGAIVTWQEKYENRLAPYMRMFKSIQY